MTLSKQKVQWRVNLKLAQYLKSKVQCLPEKLLGRTLKEVSCGLQSERVFALHLVDNKSRK